MKIGKGFKNLFTPLLTKIFQFYLKKIILIVLFKLSISSRKHFNNAWDKFKNENSPCIK